jgi:hippurate hydrolase
MCNDLVGAFGAEASVSYLQNYPPTNNSPECANTAFEVIGGILGEESVMRNIKPSMASEDFSFYLEHVPGCYIWVGNDDSDHRVALHNPLYDFNDDLIPIGVKYWVNLVDKLLG